MCELTVNLKNIKRNIIQKKAALHNGCRFCAVVKANAYGLGLERVAHAISSEVDYFAVARIGELKKLRINGIKKPILLLGSSAKITIKDCIEFGGELQVNSFNELEMISKIAKEMKKVAFVHLAFDTGMHRFGFNPINAQEISLFAKSLDSICVKGIMSHFFDAASKKSCEEQNEIFKQILQFFPGCIFHIASSGATENINFQYNMVRVGIDMYLFKHSSISFTANVLQANELKIGESCGYSRVYIATENTKIATISIGYADGMPRCAAGNVNVLINGEECKIVAVCMDCCIVKLPLWVNVAPGDQVIIVGGTQKKYLTIFDFATSCGTIPYEVLTGISDRVKRKYIYR